MVERLVINLAFHAHRKWFCVLFPNLPLSAFRETYLGKKAKQMIWLQCWRRATSVSKSHGPLTGINLPVPEMLGRRASGPPLRNGLCFQLSFLLRGIHHGSSHPTGPQHLETPAPIVPGNSPLLPLPVGHWHTYSPFLFGEVKHYSSYILLFSKFIFFLLKDSDLSHELKHQWWNWKHIPLICLPTLKWSRITNTGERNRPSLVPPWSLQVTRPRLSWSTEVDRRAIPRLSSCCGQSQVPNPKGTESVAEWDQQQALWGKPGAVWGKARGVRFRQN